LELVINGRQVSYSIENETTLGEVARGVHRWLGGAGFVVTSMLSDGVELTAAPAESWNATPLAQVERIEVQAGRTADLRLEHWRTLETWLAMVGDELQGSSQGDTLGQLLAGLPETLDGIRANPFLGGSSGERFDELLRGQSPEEVRGWPVERREELLSLISRMRASLASRIADASQPGEALKRCAGKLRAATHKLPEVSVLLQTGSDRAAMEAIIEFADAAQELLFLLPFLPPDPQRARPLLELTPILRDLVAAFGAKDSVLIGDLLEYEVTPRLQRLMPALEAAS
jgi:hypothetical protein